MKQPPDAMPACPRALVLLGHSNSGKTPLGDLLAASSPVHDARFLHLDFGSLLRKTCRREIDPGFSDTDIARIESYMRGGLLPDSAFDIARRIVEWFFRARRFEPSRDLLVLNGLPRHRGQARHLEAMGVTVTTVVHLNCSAETAWERKRLAEAGKGFEDRSGRADASREIFHDRARSYERHTLPLIDYYRQHDIRVFSVPIDVTTSPQEVMEALRGKLSMLRNGGE